MSRRDRATVLGVGAAACVACCAGPILAFLGGLAVISLGLAVVLGSAFIAVAAVGVLAFIAWRRNRRPACPVPTSVAVTAPTRRDPRTT